MDKKMRAAAIVDLDAFASNVQNIRRRTDSRAAVMGVIKADAYGHGALTMARELLFNGVENFAVATLDEAVALRNRGIAAPILILGYTPENQFDEVVKHNLTQAVYSLKQCKELSAVAAAQEKDAVVHIKIDTGMGRLGFLPGEKAIAEIIQISQLERICIEGIFTHFAAADEEDKAFTKEQYNRFITMIAKLEEKSLFIPIRHTSNSAGIIDCEQMCLNMVRPGIILYGIYPSEQVKKEKLSLEPVMSLVSRISYLKRVGENTPIGYGRTYYTNRKTKIATIPIGYADGFLRAYGKNGRVLIRGNYAPIVGRVCMDQIMVDVGNIPGVEEGEEVVLMGKSLDKEITANELAERAGTIPYEVVCGISRRVPRVYKKLGRVIEVVNYIR